MITIYKCGQVPLEQILARPVEKTAVAEAVADMISAVRREGDEALRRYAKQFDGLAPEELEVSPAEMKRAADNLDGSLRALLEEAAENIRTFHSRQVRNSFVISEKDGVILGQKVIPLERVGLYIPGGTAAYPSTVLMNAIPAKIAGCPEVIMVSPPTFGGDIHPGILAAAEIAGVDRVFRTAGPRRWPPWPMEPGVFRGWIRLSVLATPTWQKQNGRFLARWPSI